MAELIEDFEDTTYVAQFNFGSGQNAWSRVSTNITSPHGGSWCLASPAIAQPPEGVTPITATCTVTLPEGCTAIQFWYKVSTEDGYDYFQFYRGASGGSPLINESGQVAWKQSQVFDVSGVTAVRFVYYVDGAYELHDNRCYVDDIVFTVPTRTVINGWGPVPAFRTG